MPTINGRACVVNGTPVDKVFSNGKQVYGRNLLTGTSNVQDYTLSGSGYALGSQSNNGVAASIPVTPGKYYTYSVIVKSATFKFYPKIEFFDSSKKFISRALLSGTDIGVLKVKAVAPANAAFMMVSMVLQNPPESQTVVFNSEKLEVGTTAMPWSPNPADPEYYAPTPTNRAILSSPSNTYVLLPLPSSNSPYKDVPVNLFSQSTATSGYVGGGGPVYPATSSNEIVSDYIPVSASSNYTFQMWGTTPSGQAYWYGIGLYDYDKNFISRTAPTGENQTSDTAEYVSQILTTTSTTAYVRVSFRRFSDYKAKLEKDSVATDWSPAPEDVM